VGLALDVATDVEVVAHVLPGVAIALGGATAVLLARSGREADRLGLVLVGWCFLGGLWQVATHAPLVLDGGEPGAPWDAVLLHATPGPLIAVTALWLVVQGLRGRPFTA
jgi:dienelactone hydrolase